MTLVAREIRNLNYSLDFLDFTIDFPLVVFDYLFVANTDRPQGRPQR